jgi:hypothetical protein
MASSIVPSIDVASVHLQHGRLVLHQFLCERQDIFRHCSRSGLEMGLWDLRLVLSSRLTSYSKHKTATVERIFSLDGRSPFCFGLSIERRSSVCFLKMGTRPNPLGVLVRRASLLRRMLLACSCSPLPLPLSSVSISCNVGVPLRGLAESASLQCL